eukprot:UN00973
MSTEDEKKQEELSTDVFYVLNILVKSAHNLPDLDFGKKDKTDPLCKVSFIDPSNGGRYVWSTSEVFDDLNPKWNESNSWPLFFDPPDNLLITFEVFDVDSFTQAEMCGKVTLKLSELDGKPKVLKGKKCKKTTTITVEKRKQTLRFMPDKFNKDKVEYETVENVDKKLEKCARLATFNGLQSMVQKIQADNILSAANYEKKYVKVEKFKELQEAMGMMQKEYEAKLNELANDFTQKLGGITNKLDGIRN